MAGTMIKAVNADRSLISGSKNRTINGITCCIYNIYRKGQMAPNSKAKSMHLFLQSAGRWGFERWVDRVGRLLRAKS